MEKPQLGVTQLTAIHAGKLVTSQLVLSAERQLCPLPRPLQILPQILQQENAKVPILVPADVRRLSKPTIEELLQQPYQEKHANVGTVNLHTHIPIHQAIDH